MGFFARKLHELREYNDIASISEIARRYFAMNAFDGVLTIIGVLMGNYAAHVRDAKVVIVTGFSTCIAMGVSGLWGAYMTESAERKRDLSELENHTLTDLSSSSVVCWATSSSAITPPWPWHWWSSSPWELFWERCPRRAWSSQA